jgi:hypothetical protein
VVSVRLWGLPPRPIFDGLAPPPPYRWVNPPPELAAGNEQPLRGTGRIPLGPEGGAVTVATEDGQALVSVPRGGFGPPPGDGETVVRLTITPVDPAVLGPPPQDLRFDGNAYRVDAAYPGSNDTATPMGPPTVFLRYPLHADRLLRWSGTGWDALVSNRILPSLQVYAEAPELGTFVAATRDLGDPAPTPSGPHWKTLGVLAAVAALIAAAAGFLARRRIRRDPLRRPWA